MSEQTCSSLAQHHPSGTSNGTSSAMQTGSDSLPFASTRFS